MSIPAALPPRRIPVADDAVVVILTRAGCCLCDDAAAVATSVCAELGVSLRLVDIDTDHELRSVWNDHVPVTFVHGLRHALWTLDAVTLRSALRADG